MSGKVLRVVLARTRFLTGLLIWGTVMVCFPGMALMDGQTGVGVTTLGGNPFRTHQYSDSVGQALCLVRGIPVGKTLSQPLIIHHADGRTVVYHLGQTHLYALTPDGELARDKIGNPILPVKVQNTYSWGHITYSVLDPTDRSKDVIYVTLGESSPGKGNPGIAAYRASTLESLGEWRVPQNAEGIAAAPLDMGKDRIVFGVVENRMYAISGLANGSLRVEEVYREGWNSGTAVKIGENTFAVAIEPGVRAYRFVGNSLEELPGSFRVGGTEGLSQVVGEPTADYPNILYFSTKNGTLYKIDKAIFLQETGQALGQVKVGGFINTGLAVDSSHAYFGLRWLYSQDGTTTREGRLVRLNKVEWNEATMVKADLDRGTQPTAWVNVDPVVWTPTPTGLDSDRNRYVFLGDAGGAVTAWQGGQRQNMFLTAASGLPQPCEDVEKPTYDPGFVHSYRTVLTTNPRVITSGDYTWANTQGTATNMAISNGRLYTGYIEADLAGGAPNPNSSLMIFRSATNVRIAGEIKLAQENGTEVPRDSELRPNKKVKVRVPLLLEGDPLIVGKTVKVAVGWDATAAGDVSVQEVMLKPYEVTEVEAVLTVPSKVKQATITVVVNPQLYDRRHGKEAARPLPPGVSQAPGALPQGWKPLAAPAPELGEVWVLDNAITRTVAVKGDDPRIEQLGCPSSSVAPPFNVYISTAFDTGGTEPTGLQIELEVNRGGERVVRTVSERLAIQANGVRNHRFELDGISGEMRITARLVNLEVDEDVDPSNNVATCTVTAEQLNFITDTPTVRSVLTK